MESNLAYSNQSAVQIAREPEVLAELTKLGNSCEALDKLTSELEVRLKGVLSLRQEENGGASSAPEPVRVPLAQSFHDRIISLDAICARLSSIINGLEV